MPELNKWILTDDDSFQHVCWHANHVFALIQIADLTGDVYGVYIGIISLDEYSEEEIRSYLRDYDYDYDSVENLKEIYGDSWPQIVAECIFETDLFLDFICVFEGTYSQCRDFIKERISNAERG